MRGMGHSDPIETVTFKHEEGNEGEKTGVKRGIGAFYGGKLLKRQGRRETAPPEFWTPSGRRCTAYQNRMTGARQFPAARTLRKTMLFSLLVAGLVSVSSADAPESDQDSGAPLKHLSLEQLGDIEVTTASKEQQVQQRTAQLNAAKRRS